MVVKFNADAATPLNVVLADGGFEGMQVTGKVLTPESKGVSSVRLVLAVKDGEYPIFL